MNRTPNRTMVTANLAMAFLVLAFIIYNTQHSSLSEKNSAPLNLDQKYRNDTAAFLGYTSDDVIEFKKLLSTIPDSSKVKLPLLWDAVAHNRIRCLTFLLDSGVPQNRPEDLMNVAVGTNHVECARILIKHGFPINFAPREGYSPLHYASMSRERLESLEFLLDHNANINIKTTRADISLRSISPKINRYPNQYYYRSNLTRIAGNTPLIIAITYGNTEGVHLLVQRGCDLNAKNSEGMTALQWIDYLKQAYQPGYSLPQPAILEQMQQMILDAKKLRAKKSQS